MKLIVAIIRPEKVAAVRSALREALDEGDNYRITIQAVEGHGRQGGVTEYFRGREVRTELVHKMQLMIAVNDRYVEPTIEAILGAARGEGKAAGDGKIFVLPLEECVRIRTGERGGAAI
ncbi:MAG: Nitrogen regulatory protein P-II [Phycisphaerae bacterium]|nr:Nitrogen regulatory protein P-II [Phycisphaerae bacterium]